MLRLSLSLLLTACSFFSNVLLIYMPSVSIALLEALLEFEGDYVLVELSILFQFFLVNHCCVFLVIVFLIFTVGQT